MDPLPTFPPLTLNIPDERLPIQPDGHGGYRIGGSRITLDLVIGRFNDGYSPEMLTHSFDTLQLADVYSVIGFYLRHRSEVDAYLRQRQQQADAARAYSDSRHDPSGVRERLLARKTQRSS